MTSDGASADGLLSVTDVTKRFGGIVAVDGMSFELREGEITGLIGPNGAGKTTMFNLCSGVYVADEGRIAYRGESLGDVMQPDREERTIMAGTLGLGLGVAGLAAATATDASTVVGAGSAVAGGGVGGGLYYASRRARRAIGGDSYQSRPHQISRAGLSRTFQITRELSEMSVLENLMLAPQNQTGERLLGRWLRYRTVADEEAVVRETAREKLELLEIEHLADERAGNLSGGQRKLLELGRVLMTEPELILLDEPMAGVNPTLSRKLLDRIETLREEGYSFCLIEHDMDVIMELSDRIVVMANGSKLMEGSPEEVRTDERVLDAYLGQ